MGIKRKNNPRYKKIKSYRDSDKGLVDVERYILNMKPFDYTSPTGSRGTIFAVNKADADKKLALSFKQERYDFGDIVVFARGKKEAERKADTRRRNYLKNKILRKAQGYVN